MRTTSEGTAQEGLHERDGSNVVELSKVVCEI
jgi:hypothetical protein